MACSAKPSRRCRTASFDPEVPDDCFLPEIDSASKGTCEGEVWLEGDARVIDVKYVGNRISGGSVGLVTYLTPGGRIEGNVISSCEQGLVIGDDMLASGTVVGNVSRGNGVGLAIDNLTASSAGAVVSFNDFVDNTTAVTALQSGGEAPYELPTVLPHNHWGRSCEPADLPEAVSTPRPYRRPVAKRFLRAGDDDVDPRELGRFCD